MHGVSNTTHMADVQMRAERENSTTVAEREREEGKKKQKTEMV